MIMRDVTNREENLQSSSGEVVLVPEKLIVLDNATNHVQEWLALELASQRVDPGSVAVSKVQAGLIWYTHFVTFS
jgi:hypothetical protein